MFETYGHYREDQRIASDWWAFYRSLVLGNASIESIPIMTYNWNNSEAIRPRKDIREDYIGSLSYEGKGYWEHLTLYNLYKQGCRVYPEDMKRLYNPKKMYNFKVKMCKKIISLLTLFGYI